jgi:hypothetical protein
MPPLVVRPLTFTMSLSRRRSRSLLRRSCTISKAAELTLQLSTRRAPRRRPLTKPSSRKSLRMPSVMTTIWLASADAAHATPQEISIHRYKARTSVCPRGPECADYDCYLSHHCLKDPRCTRGNSCKFTNTEYGNLHLNTNEKLQPVYVLLPSPVAVYSANEP